MRTFVASAALLFGFAAYAQSTPLLPAPAANQASVEFNFQWNDGVPWQSYSIQISADGKTHFEGKPNPSQGGDVDPVTLDFVTSVENRQRIFALARKLNYFQGDLDSHLKHIAQSGAKTLVYKSTEVHGSATYNYSPNPDVQQLTQFFLGLATTLDYGRKLAWNYRFDKLGMNQTLRELQELQTSHQVDELSAIEPILRKIASDPSLMHISRQTAEHLVKTIGSTDAANPTTQP